MSACEPSKINMAPEATKAPNKEGCCKGPDGCCREPRVGHLEQGCSLRPSLCSPLPQSWAVAGPGVWEALIKAACLSIWAHVDHGGTSAAPASGIWSLQS